jgi:uncharacterized integral membrane protein (TIGR00697 family)
MNENRLNTKQLLPYMLAMGSIIAVSNVLVQYPLGTWLTYGALTYPVAFLVTDLANRAYGPEGAKRVILIGFLVGIVASLCATVLALTTFRIAIASATAFLVAQLLDVKVFDRLRNLPWWQTPALSSAIGSVVDTFLFFGIAFSATTYLLIADGNDWALEVVPLLGIGRELPLWVSLAFADLGIKLAMIFVLLLPYRYLTRMSE